MMQRERNLVGMRCAPGDNAFELGGIVRDGADCYQLLFDDFRIPHTLPGWHTGVCLPMPPTRTRYRAAGFLLGLAAVTYLDRICISILAPDIARDLSLTKLQMSFVFSAFAVAYAAFEIVTAWWGERIGPRRVLTRIVVWWSCFTIATAFAWNYASLLVIRFLFGAGEAGAWPNAALAFSRWTPVSERGRAQGFFFAAAHLSGGLTPLLVAALLPHMSWRVIFAACGVVGFLWAVSWSRWFRDEPRDHPQVNAAEAELIETGRRISAHHHAGKDVWRALAASPGVWFLCLAYFSNSYGSYFVMTWLPTYLAERRGFEKESLSFFSGLPLLLSVFGDITGGAVTDFITRRFGLRLGRSGVAVIGYAVAGAAMFASVLSTTPVMAASLIAVAVAASMFTLSASWAACIDIGGEHTAVLSAAMNTTGQIGSILSPIVTGWVVTHFSNWQMPLLIMGAFYVASAIFWTQVDPRKRLRLPAG
jgi:ACS family glucarate transporter-like MFS transporter